MTEQITLILVKCLSPDNTLRTQGENQLKQAREQNLAVFIATLVVILNDESKKKEARQMAGIVLKTELHSKDVQKKEQLASHWKLLDPSIKEKIRSKILNVIVSKSHEPRISSRFFSSIASIEINEGRWDEIINLLTKNIIEKTKTPTGGVESSLLTLGFLCEKCGGSKLVEENSSKILTAVIHGMRNRSNPKVRLASTDSFYRCLDVVKKHFQKEDHRNFIFQCLLECAISEDPNVRRSSLECLVKISSVLYPAIGYSLNSITNVTVKIITNHENEPPNVVMQAIEFWSSLAEVERDIMDEVEEANEMNQQPKRKCHDFVKNKLDVVCKALTSCLLRPSEEVDAWDVSSAAGTCISLISRTVGDDIVKLLMPFITSGLSSEEEEEENQNKRSSAVLALSAILDGPKTGSLGVLITNSIPLLLHRVRESNDFVQDNTMFCLGRIVQFQPSALIRRYFEPVLKTLMFGANLKEKPKIAEKACWAIMNIAKYFENNSTTSPTATNALPVLKRYYQELCEKMLMVTSQKDNFSSPTYLINSYEALNQLVTICSPEYYAFLEQRVVKVLVERLTLLTSFHLQRPNDNNAGTQLEHLETIQGLLCGVLGMCTDKLGRRIKPFSDSLMRLYLTLLKSKNNPCVHQEVFTAIGPLASAIEDDFSKYMNHLLPCLVAGLRNEQMEEVCNAAVLCVVDIGHAIKKRLSVYSDEIIRALLLSLKSSVIALDLKPQIVNSFGDIAFAIGGEFKRYSQQISVVLKNAGSAKVNREGDDAMVEYINTLRENVLDTYSSILQGVKKDDPNIFNPFVKSLIELISVVYQDKSTDQEVIVKACICIGDLVNVYGQKCKEYINFPFIRNLIQECSMSNDVDTKRAAEYTRTQITTKFGNY